MKRQPRVRVTTLGCDRAFLAVDGMKAREDDVFVRHVETFSGGAAAREQMMLVQLGGLEPPTSCSTDRRSNQLSYNCILSRARKAPNEAETRCNGRLWQGRQTPQSAAKPHAKQRPGQPPGPHFNQS